MTVGTSYTKNKECERKTQRRLYALPLDEYDARGRALTRTYHDCASLPPVKEVKVVARRRRTRLGGYDEGESVEEVGWGVAHAKEGKRDAVFFPRKLLYFLLLPRLLVAELVAREAEDDEAFALVLSVELLQPSVVGVRRASRARQIHHEGDFAVMFSQRGLHAVDVVSR